MICPRCKKEITPIKKGFPTKCYLPAVGREIKYTLNYWVCPLCDCIQSLPQV